MKKLSLLVALAVTVVAHADEPVRQQGDTCPRWVAVLPLTKGNAASIAKDAAALGEETFIDGIVWLCALHPEGTPPTDKAALYAAIYRETAACLRKLSAVKQGVLLQSTIGHGGWPPASPAPFQCAVPPDAATKTWRVCPLDREFLAYVARTCRTLNALKPDFFMVDDDTRLKWRLTRLRPQSIGSAATACGARCRSRALWMARSSWTPSCSPSARPCSAGTRGRFARPGRAGTREMPLHVRR